MKFKRVKFNEFQESHIEYCGKIIATTEELEKIFGQRKAVLRTGYSETSWDIKFEDGTVACIYDWNPKRGEASKVVQISWNIASMDPNKRIALYYVRHTVDDERYDKDSIRMIF